MVRGPSTNPRYEYQKAWNIANAKRLRAAQLSRYGLFRKLVDDYKMERGCIDCGFKGHPAALDLDHRDPTQKRVNVARMSTYQKSQLLEELAKCDVRCANCHRIKSVTDGDTRRRRSKKAEADEPT